MSKPRLHALIAMGTLGIVAALAALVTMLAAPAGPAQVSARVEVATTSPVSFPCEPANNMTGQQRAAMIAALPAQSFRFASQCRTAGGIHTTALREFTGKTTFQLTYVNLQDTLCDNRSVYADVYTDNGWLGEFVNSAGCHSDAVWDDPIHFTDVGNVQYVFIRLYACNSTSCSSYTDSARHWNPYVASSKNPVNSTFNFQNNTGGEIAAFSASLD